MDALISEFVEYMPKEPKEGVLYISIRFRTAIHRCACGCGNKTVTKLSPTDWKLTFNGIGVSLYPSIGNWGFPCQSHYWIRENRVEWAEQWSNERIIKNRIEDKKRKNYFYSEGGVDSSEGQNGLNDRRKNICHRLINVIKNMLQHW